MTSWITTARLFSNLKSNSPKPATPAAARASRYAARQAFTCSRGQPWTLPRSPAAFR